jgi:predicted choloylglycine hydrolase
MTAYSMQFDAVAEDLPGPKWQARWQRSWPDYRAWFLGRQGQNGPSRAACEQALDHYMPELLPVWRRLCQLAGNDDLAARFLSTWCPPAYLGGCSLAAVSRGGSIRLVRNYDLSPELNEGLLLRSAWTGTPVMGMIEFLWGLSDGINQHGLAVALAYGGRETTGRGFGITTILRYLMETCTTVADALAVLQRVPSHMAYNISLADRSGMTLSVELQPGGGVRIMEDAIATNHQHGAERASRPEFTQTVERLDHLAALLTTAIEPDALAPEFLRAPLFQSNYAGGLGTLFTAEYDPSKGELVLWWPGSRWPQSLAEFQEGSRHVPLSTHVQPTADYAHYGNPGLETTWLDALASLSPHVANPEAFEHWLQTARGGDPDWMALSGVFYATTGRRDANCH